MGKVRWGLLSTADINSAVIPAIRLSERGELTAVASRSQESAAAYAAKWDIPQSFGSYEAMLNSDAVDAVYISLPNHLHAPWSIAAMERGKHVLCEKPFALSLDEVDQVAAVAKETGMVITEAFMYRHHPQTKAVGEFIKSGRLGDVLAVRGVFTFKIDPGFNVRLEREMGGGSIWDVGCYPISMAQYVMGGPPAWVFGDQLIGPSGVDDVFVGQMHWEDGRMGQFTSGFRTPLTAAVEILGTEGRLDINAPFKPTEPHWAGRKLYFQSSNDRSSLPEEIPVPDAAEHLYLGEVADLEAAILDGAGQYLSLEETKNHIRTILAFVESAAEVKPVWL